MTSKLWSSQICIIENIKNHNLIKNGGEVGITLYTINVCYYIYYINIMCTSIISDHGLSNSPALDA